MKPILLIACLALTGCSTTVHHLNGTPWIRSYSNIGHLEAHSGTESIVIDKLNNSTPTRAAAKFADILGADAVAIATGGGSGITPLVSKAVISGTPRVTGLMTKPGDQ